MSNRITTLHDIFGKAGQLGDPPLFAWGTTVPVDATAGYRPGCIFIHAPGDPVEPDLYLNCGTETASCAFKKILTTVDGIDDFVVGATGSMGVPKLLAWGTAVPSDEAAGYAPGCLFLDTNAGLRSMLYMNYGSATSCNFDLITDVATEMAAMEFGASQSIGTPAFYKWGTTVPSGFSGYAKGCLFVKTDDAGGAPIYVNNGDHTTPSFVKMLNTAGGLGDVVTAAASGKVGTPAVLAWGTTVPADETAGYLRGCLFYKTDATTQLTIPYINIGSDTSSNFDLYPDFAGGMSAAALATPSKIGDPAVIAWGTTVPTDTTAGYYRGCLFYKTDATTQLTVPYINIGTHTSCNFDLFPDYTGGMAAAAFAATGQIGVPAVIAWGTVVPSDEAAGYMCGCKFYKTDATTLDTIEYMNIGSSTSCNFDVCYLSNQA